MVESIKDLSGYSIGPQTPIRVLLEQLNRSEHLFQIVVGDNGQLLGTVTDGDIRRSILSGATLDSPTSVCMQNEPIVGEVGRERENRKKLVGLGSTRALLPIVDTSNVVREILAANRGADSGMALVMAGGMGKRLGKRTRDTPKPLLDVGGKPILDHVLSALEDANFDDVYISLHYLASQISEFVTERDSKCRIHTLEEDAPLGTAGALGLMPPDLSGPVLVVNGDVITRVDFARVHDFHVRHGLDGTICVARYDVDVPFGVVEYGEDGLFQDIKEKPCISNFIAAGVYYLSPEFRALVSKSKPMDMPDLLRLGRQIGLRVGLFPIHEYWTDVGHPGDLELAQRDHEGRAG